MRLLIIVDVPAVRAGADAPSVSPAEARPGGARLCREIAPAYLTKPRSSATWRCSSPITLPARFRRRDSPAHRRAPALRGRPAARPAAAAGPPAAGRPVDDRRGSAALARELPESVRSLVQRKIDALDDDDRRLLAAASVQGVDFDTALVAACVQVGRGGRRDSAGAARARARARPVRRRARSAGPAADAALPLRAPRLSQRVLRLAARHAPGRAQPRDCRAAGGARRRAAATARRTSRCCSKPRATTFAPRNTGTRRRRPPRGCTRTTRPSGSRSAGLALLESEPASPARSAAELDLQMTYGLAIKTSRGYAVPEVGRRTRGARAVPPGRRSGACRPCPDRPVGAPHRVGRNHDRARRRAGDARALQPAGRPEPADDRPVVARRRAVPPGRARSRSRAPGAGAELYDPSFHGPRVWETGIDPGIFCRCELARTLTLRGFPDHGLAMVQDAVAAAGRSSIRSRWRSRCSSR